MNSFDISQAVVINEIMYHDRPTYQQERLDDESGPTAILPFDAQGWRYRESPNGLESDWAMQSHPDWPVGAGPLGFQAETLDELGTVLNASVSIARTNYDVLL